MNWYTWLVKQLGHLVARLKPTSKVRVVRGDTLPAVLPRRDLVLLQDDGEDWSVGFLCPCGCGDTLELALLPEVKPNWKLTVDIRGRPTLHPSIWRTVGCQSHFWVRSGRIVWCG